MRKSILILTIAISLFSCSSYNDLNKNHNIGDKVIQITETRVSNIKLPKKEIILTLTYKFNDFGNTTYFSKVSEYDKSEFEYYYDENNFLVKEVQKDEFGKIYEEIHYEKENSKLINFKILNDNGISFIGSKNLDTDGNILNEKTFYPNGSLCIETNNKYDKLKNKVSSKFLRLKDNFVDEYYYEYSGNLLKAMIIDDISKFDGSKMKVKFEYTFDSKNNWILKKEFLYDEKNPTFEIIRVIEYMK